VQWHSRLKLQFCTCNDIKHVTKVPQKDTENAKTLAERQQYMPVTVLYTKQVLIRRAFHSVLRLQAKEVIPAHPLHKDLNFQESLSQFIDAAIERFTHEVLTPDRAF